MIHKALGDTAKPITTEALNELRQQAKHLKKTGEDLLFWAGQMSSAAGKIPLASPLELSAHLITLDKIRQEYDRAILGRMTEKNRQEQASWATRRLSLPKPRIRR